MAGFLEKALKSRSMHVLNFGLLPLLGGVYDYSVSVHGLRNFGSTQAEFLTQEVEFSWLAGLTNANAYVNIQGVLGSYFYCNYLGIQLQIPIFIHPQGRDATLQGGRLSALSIRRSTSKLYCNWVSRMNSKLVNWWISGCPKFPVILHNGVYSQN